VNSFSGVSRPLLRVDGVHHRGGTCAQRRSAAGSCAPKDIRAEAARGARFTRPLDDDQLAFYNAVSQNESAVLLQGEDVLAQIARDLVAVMRRDVRTDWTVRDDVRATLRSSIKRLLVRHGYPPDQQPGAIKLVIEQRGSGTPRRPTSGSRGTARNPGADG
jgi:hypothetical protein